MSNIVVYFHDPVEVNLLTSWTGLCPPLANAQYVDITKADNPNVIALFDYARPDAVITVDDQPVVSIEQTAMNPSGHNIPQRFSFQVRAAELGVPSILYYPEFSRRTFSDPNVRYLNIRVPLAQKRLSQIYKIPAVSIFWPTDPTTKLPTTEQKKHTEIAIFVELLINNADNPGKLLTHPAVVSIFSRMEKAVSNHINEYVQNLTVRQFFPDGLSTAKAENDITIDPPNKARLEKTELFLKRFDGFEKNNEWEHIREKLLSRIYTIIFTGTANHARNDSEHPWPGYLTLIDILYARSEGGKLTEDRDINLVYSLPVPIETALGRINAAKRPTATNIVDTFSDLLIYSGGVIPGRPIRKSIPAFTVLSQ